MLNSLQPSPAVLRAVTPLTADDRLFLFLSDEPMFIAPGQFIEISIPGVGGFPVSPCDVVKGRQIWSCIRRTGRVTRALFELENGTTVGLRGPFGNGFDLTHFINRDVLLLAGGLGIAPLRALLAALLKARQHKRLWLLFGAKTFSTLLFRDELVELAQKHEIELFLAVENEAGEGSFPTAIPCRIGLVTSLLDELSLQSESTVAAVSGPPALYRGVLDQLAARGVPEDRIFATLERRMRCGVGECCHCVTGGVYLCQEGPVFSLAKIRTLEGAL